VRFRPVYPLAIRTPEFFDNLHPQWPSYFMRDVFRAADFLGLPFAPPRPDPVVQEHRDGRFVTRREQPYIHRLTRIGVVAEERGRGIEFADEVSRVIWSGTEDWHVGSHLADATARAGLDLEELDEVAQKERDRVESAIEQNQADHEAAGHWGVPTCAFRGEPFFGQDRLDVLLWRLQQNGLHER
jgi:2-hydroxychromene-2-carboxylate isomerase